MDLVPLLFAALLAGLAAGNDPMPPEGFLLDRVVAVVENESILASEVEATIALGLVLPLEGEGAEALRRRTLDLLVDERLRARDLARFGEPEVAPDEVEDEVDRLAEPFGGREALERIALDNGLEPAPLRAFLRRQLAAIRAADDRFGGAVFVTDDEVAEFLACDTGLRSRLEAEGVEGVPKVDAAMAAEVRALIVRRRISEQLDRWMAGLRARARIDYRDGRPLPPPAAATVESPR